MDTFTVGNAAVVLGVSADTVRRWVDGGRLASRRTAGGRRLIDGQVLARFAEEINPHAPGANPRQVSTRNRFPGIVTRVLRDTVMAQVEVQCGPYRLVSLVSREAADQLGLEPGVAVVTAVKATNVMVELPATR